MPDLSKKAKDLRAVEGIDQSQFESSAPVPPSKKTARAQKIAERTVVVPKACRLNITNSNSIEIYKELSSLKLKQFPNAIAVLLRVFIENSVDHYLEANNIPLKFTPPKGTQKRYKPLDTKVREAIDNMVNNGAEGKYFDGVTRALADQNHPLSIDLQHAYVHNRYVTPSERDLVLAWDNAQAFFEKLWP